VAAAFPAVTPLPVGVVSAFRAAGVWEEDILVAVGVWEDILGAEAVRAAEAPDIPAVAAVPAGRRIRPGKRKVRL
jgi:hypothetical protein